MSATVVAGLIAALVAGFFSIAGVIVSAIVTKKKSDSEAAKNQSAADKDKAEARKTLTEDQLLWRDEEREYYENRYKDCEERCTACVSEVAKLKAVLAALLKARRANDDAAAEVAYVAAEALLWGGK